MPKFTVEHETSISKAETFKKVQDYLEHSGGLRKLDSDLKCTFDDETFTGHVKGSKFEANLQVTDGTSGKTKVLLEISIGLLLTPFKGKIQETLKGKMIQMLG